jgi:hypothetical protein
MNISFSHPPFLHSPFLHLPLEIRGLIIREVILGGNGKAPGGPNDLDFQNRILQAEKERDTRFRLLSEIQSMENPVLPLLRTCRQIYHETKWVLSAKSLTEFTRYTLDVACFDDGNDAIFYPTWLSVPWRASRIDELYIRLRFNPANIQIPDEDPNISDPLISSLVRSLLYCKSTADQFCQLLIHVLEIPRALEDLNGHDLKLDLFTIGRLVLDFIPEYGLDGPDFNLEEKFPWWWICHKDGEDGTSAHHHDQAFSLLREQAAHCSLYSQVGEVEYHLAGGPNMKLSLGHRLHTVRKKLGPRGPGTWSWFDELAAKRIRAGLPA